MDKPKAVAIVSGGLDSTVMLYQLLEGSDVDVLSFNYGQRHAYELAHAELICRRLEVPFRQVDLRNLQTGVLDGSALTDTSIDVPEGHYEAESMKLTIVPNRNAIMLSIAYAYAEAHGANFVAIAVHAGDHAIYPDCRPAFVSRFERMERLALDHYIPLLSPFIDMTKADIVKEGARLGVPFSATWSCYKGGVPGPISSTAHCGRCGTCVERKEAFRLAGVADPTEYADESFGVEVYRG